MNRTKNQKKWMANLMDELEKVLSGEEESNIAGVDVYICHPPVAIRIKNIGKGSFKSSAI